MKLEFHRMAIQVCTVTHTQHSPDTTGNLGVTGSQRQYQCSHFLRPTHPPHVEVLDVDVLVRSRLSLAPKQQTLLCRQLYTQQTNKQTKKAYFLPKCSIYIDIYRYCPPTCKYRAFKQFNFQVNASYNINCVSKQCEALYGCLFEELQVPC